MIVKYFHPILGVCSGETALNCVEELDFKVELIKIRIAEFPAKRPIT